MRPHNVPTKYLIRRGREGARGLFALGQGMPPQHPKRDSTSAALPSGAARQR